MKDIRELLEFHLFTLAGTPVNVVTLFASLVVIGVAVIFSRVAEKSATRFLERRGAAERGTIEASARLIRYIVLAVGLMVAIHTLGIQIASLFTAGAVLAVGVGFAMQNIMQNFVSGIILLTERSITPDDILEVDGVVVKVMRMDMRSTVAQNWYCEDLIIPNSQLVSATVKNFTLTDARIRIKAVVGVAYESDMREVRHVLEQTARALSWRDAKHEPTIYMTAFGNSSVNFMVLLDITDPWERLQRESDLNEAVWFGLKDAGITIAFPQLDVHMYPEPGPEMAKR